MTSVLAAISQLLDRAGVPYMVVGSFASSLHGEPRTTFDLDLVIDPDRAQLEALLQELGVRYYVDPEVARDALQRRAMFNAIDTESGWKIDFIVRKARAFSIEEFRRRRRELVDGVPVFVASVEDTILAKLEWAKAGGSERQLEDVRRMLRVQGTLDDSYLAKWIADLGLAAEWAQVSG